MSGELQPENEPSTSKPPKPIQRETNWPIVLFYIYLHMSTLYAFILIFTEARIYTVLFAFMLVALGSFSITTGCHRLWTHGSYKAVWPLRVFLVLAHTLCCHSSSDPIGVVILLLGLMMTGVSSRNRSLSTISLYIYYLVIYSISGSVYDWVKEHRAHHKLRNTDYDKFDYRKGFMFAHILSHCVNTDPRITKEEEKVDMSDLEEDKVVMYQNRLYWIVMPILGILLPINAPVEYWGESILASVFVVGFLRVCLLWQAAWFVNSGNILWGLDPLDRKSGDTVLVFFFNKSLWPQYHYLLPWDYKSGEYGTYGEGMSTALIRVWAALGMAYDLKTCSSTGIKAALTAASNSNKPILECLEENKNYSTLPEILDCNQHKA